MHRNGNFQISWHHQNGRFRGAALIRIKKVWHAASFGQLNAKTWYHLAATYDGHTLKAYVKGKLINSNDQMEGRADAETETLKIGRHALYKNYFRGWVQDVRLYNRALKADEMAVFGSGG